jgi:flavin-dependent dehydrogenase
MGTIKVLGGGIAGLTAAINLKMAGLDVEVHERKQYCGKSIRDFQFLDNWTFEGNVLDNLKGMNIPAGFYAKPYYRQEIFSPSLKRYIGKSDKPLMYLIKRGNQHDSLDRFLENLALSLDVHINYNSTLKSKYADIIATGIKKPTYIGTGLTFDLSHPDRSYVLLDNQLSQNIYSYCIVNNNVGEIVCINPAQSKDHIKRLNLTVRRFEKILSIKIESNRNRFSAPGSFYFKRSAVANHQYHIGEAAGFQDCLLGFGMIYAFKSGHMAAKSIIESIDYDRLWKQEILKPMKISIKNRRIYERLSNKGFEKIVALLNSRNFLMRKLWGGDDLRHRMKKAYNHSLPLFFRLI